VSLPVVANDYRQAEHSLRLASGFFKKFGRGPPEGRFSYFPKLFPVRWLIWKVEALPALGVISASCRKNLRILLRTFLGRVKKALEYVSGACSLKPYCVRA
jgi:hypothetical protein